MGKKLYRNTRNKMLAGVCSGVAEYFGIDPTIVRVIWVLVGLCYFVGIILYIACIFIIPEKPSDYIEA